MAAQCREPCTVKGSIGFVGSESLTVGQSKLLEPMNDEQFMIEARKALEANAHETADEMKKTTNPTRRIVMPNSRNSRAEAWRRLGIEDPSVLETLPRITRILAAAKQGLPHVLLALRASADPDARAFVRKYDSVSPSDRRYRIGSNWDAIAFAAGVDPLRLLEVAVSSLCRAGENVGPIIAAASHPRITKKTVQMAMTDKGHRERKMLLSATGFLPTPKDSTIIGRVQLANGPKAPKEEQNSRVLLPSMEDDLKLLHSSSLPENRLLPKG